MAVIFPVSISVFKAINKSLSEVGLIPSAFFVAIFESEVSTGTCPGN